MSKNIETIKKIEALLAELKASLGDTSPKNKKLAGTGKTTLGFSGLTGEIYKLVQEGFFRKPNRRKISDIKKKLHQRTINKPSTSLMKPLRLLIRKDVLDREKPDGKGQYEYFEVE